MTDKELRRLGRAELLELLLSQGKELETLQAKYDADMAELQAKYDKDTTELTEKLDEARKKLEDRTIALDEAGSIAQASLQINGIFEAAQKAADQYLDNIRILSERQDAVCAQKESAAQELADKILAEANSRCTAMEYDTKRRCEVMTAKAKAEADNYWEDVSTKLEDFYNAHAGLRELLSIDIPTRGSDQ